MPWGARKRDGSVGKISKPEPVIVDNAPSAVKNNPDLRAIQDSIDKAKSAQEMGGSNAIAETVSLTSYAPPEDALRGALGHYWHG